MCRDAGAALRAVSLLVALLVTACATDTGGAADAGRGPATDAVRPTDGSKEGRADGRPPAPDAPAAADAGPVAPCAPVPFAEWEAAGACGFYTCFEGRVSCGEEGYLLAFACKYADRYLSDVYPGLTDAGQAFLRSVFECLQGAMAAQGPSAPSCASIAEIGFGSHVPCYLEAGFCELPGADVGAIFAAIDPPDLQNPLQQAAMRAVAEACYGD